VGIVASVVAPPPSQIALIIARRSAALPVRSAGSRLLKQYYEDHPELAANQPDRSDFYKKYILVEDQVDAATAPLEARARERFAASRRVARGLAFASPALLFAEGLADLAGEGDRSAPALEGAARSLYAQQRAFLLPRLFADRAVTRADLAQWPAAPRLEASPDLAEALGVALGLLGWTAALAVLAGRPMTLKGAP
jgi:ABC-2 type transport system permease protein